MRGRLSSPRFRRRLGWLAILVLVAGLITLAATKYANTGASNATPLIDKPATVYRIPARMHLSKQDRNDLFDVTSRFVRTAVARKHLDSAWNMLGPELKAGQTHKSWDTGFNNVVPFKADGIGLFSILYAYQNDVAIDTGLVSGKGSGWAAKTFTIELKRYPGQPHHWLVASWVPKGIGGGGTLSPSRRGGPPRLPPPGKSRWQTPSRSPRNGTNRLIAEPSSTCTSPTGMTSSSLNSTPINTSKCSSSRGRSRLFATASRTSACSTFRQKSARNIADSRGATSSRR